MWESISSWFGAQAFNTKMAMWTAVIATSSFGLGAVAHSNLEFGERFANQLGQDGHGAGAIQVLSSASAEARATMHGDLRATYRDSDQRLDDHLTQLNEDTPELEGEEIDRRLHEVFDAYGRQRAQALRAYVITYQRERMQLEAMSADWPADAKALAQTRIEELRELERKVTDALVDGEGAEAAIALNQSSHAEVEAQGQASEQHAELTDVEGASAVLGSLNQATAPPDTVSAKKTLAQVETYAAQPDTVAGKKEPVFALADDVEDDGDAVPTRRTLDMELGVSSD
jgi:hypothetical protein